MLDEQKSEVKKIDKTLEKLISDKKVLTAKIKDMSETKEVNIDSEATILKKSKEVEVKGFEPVFDQAAKQMKSDTMSYRNLIENVDNNGPRIEESDVAEPVVLIKDSITSVNQSPEPRRLEMIPFQNKQSEIEISNRSNQPLYLDGSDTSFSPKKIKFGYVSADNYKYTYEQPTYIQNYDHTKETSYENQRSLKFVAPNWSDENIELQNYDSKENYISNEEIPNDVQVDDRLQDNLDINEMETLRKSIDNLRKKYESPKDSKNNMQNSENDNINFPDGISYINDLYTQSEANRFLNELIDTRQASPEAKSKVEKNRSEDFGLRLESLAPEIKDNLDDNLNLQSTANVDLEIEA